MKLTDAAQAAAIQAGAQLKQAGIGLYEALNLDLTDFNNIAPMRFADLSERGTMGRE